MVARKPAESLLGSLLLIGLGGVSAFAEQRLFVLTDIGGNPDDQIPMVQLMTYANQMDIEGLVATQNGRQISGALLIESFL